MTETFSVTFEVDVDTENLDEQIHTQFTEVAGKEIKGEAEADLENVLKEVVSEIRLSESTAPEPVGFALEHAVVKRK